MRPVPKGNNSLISKEKAGYVMYSTKSEDRKKYNIPSTIDDPAILKEIEEPVKLIRFDKKKPLAP